MEKSNRKVLILTSSYPKYTSDMNGNFVFELASRLKNGLDIYVLAPDFKDSLSFEIKDGIKIYRHKQFFSKNIELAYGNGIYENLKGNKLKYLMLPFYFIFQMQMLIKIVKKEKINIVHAHWLVPNALIAVFCRKIFNLDIKILATIHGSDFWGFNNSIGNYLKKYTLQNIDALTVVSNAIKEKVSEYGYNKEIFIYPMGIDTTLFAPDKKDETLKAKLKIKGPFLLFVGIVVEQKGIRQLIQAMPAIVDKFPKAKLVVIGDGNLKNEMIDFSKQLNISDHIIFNGITPHSELPAYFATADIFILPSFSEGWPVVVMEALSSGTTTIVTDIPVFTKHEYKSKLFTIVQTGNSKSLALGINRLLFDNGIIPQECELRNYAIKNLEWSIISNKYKCLIQNLTK